MAIYLDPLTRGTGCLYGQKMMRTARPARMPRLERIMANDEHPDDLTRQAKERMSEPARG